MENRKPEENSDEKIRYLNAQKRVKEIRGFYAHLVSYIAVNIILIIFNILYHELGYMKIKVNQFYSLIVWGIIILVHAGFVFLGKDWEQRKIRKLMDKEK
ncbi:2TM domain-containing protein [Epilithonimonas hungarica]|uniref:2TM domain-containing protein n=1 Tax=Epilithonimonas hungarica TaxID=454006 RepID=A0A1G7PVD1_9FLAO|nr:2TM domain-containing protein [Epilithonimonas hungarica]SDF90201.1 2TM domain-containing protein [Epilithonimonas hungarica]